MLETLRRAVTSTQAFWEAARRTEGVTPHRVVWRSGPACLRAYAPQGTTTATPLLLVTPIINRFRIVDLDAGVSLTESLVQRGIPVYVLDWGAPRRIDADTGWEDYVLRLLPRALRAAGLEQVDLLGYCLGGTLAAMFAARSPQRVRRLVTLNAPVRFLDAPLMDLMRQWVEPEHFPVERLTRAFGNMPGGLVLSGFLWQKPLASALKLAYAWPRMSDPDFARRYWALESWNQDSVDIPGAAYRRLIVELYRDDALAQGRFSLAGEPVDLSRITAPVLVVTNLGDTTCPPEAAKALLDLVGSASKQALELPGGHVLGVVGPRAKAQVHDPIADWLLQ